jgi:hypothetical protein
MSVIKRLVRLPFNLLGLQIVKMDGYNSQRRKVNEIINKANTYYKESLEIRADSLTDPEYLQLLELKYGGYITEVPATIDSSKVNKIHSGNLTGGDRMNVFFHDYSSKYSEYLSPLRQSNDLIRILEVGILKGTGLAVWSKYFNYKEIYGFDYDLGNFQDNKSNLIELDAFKDGLPITKFYDQFAYNSETLKETFGDKKLDVVVDDAFHSDESIINTFDELQPYLAEKFVYFIEDNRTAWKKLQVKYPNYKFDYNDDELTVVSRKLGF